MGNRRRPLEAGLPGTSHRRRTRQRPRAGPRRRTSTRDTVGLRKGARTRTGTRPGTRDTVGLRERTRTRLVVRGLGVVDAADRVVRTRVVLRNRHRGTRRRNDRIRQRHRSPVRRSTRTAIARPPHREGRPRRPRRIRSLLVRIDIDSDDKLIDCGGQREHLRGVAIRTLVGTVRLVHRSGRAPDVVQNREAVLQLAVGVSEGRRDIDKGLKRPLRYPDSVPGTLPTGHIEPSRPPAHVVEGDGRRRNVLLRGRYSDRYEEISRSVPRREPARRRNRSVEPGTRSRVVDSLYRDRH